MNHLYRKIPKIDELLNLNSVNEAIKIYPREFVLDILRNILKSYREKIRLGENISFSLMDISDIFEKELLNKSKNSLRRVVNATGVVIHTNLGRSKMCRQALENIIEVSSYYSNLEYDLENGCRGSRYSHVEKLICDILHCESALVVNNNASAIMLVLNTLCNKKEVIVSRGELVEIGGSFRIPEVMNFSGAILKEVGCTNRTHLFDYENEINENTSAFLKVHTSNYYISGFIKDVRIDELKLLKEKHNKIIIEDIGSGSIIDFNKYGLQSKNNLVQESLKNGADIVTFSGDKMLGGPQAGIIVGRKDLIDKIKSNHLLRALRVDKFTLAGLEGTLKCYLDEKFALENIPTLRMITEKLETLKSKSEILYNKIKNIENFQISIEEGFSIIGGGSMPQEQIKTYVLDIKHKFIYSKQLEELLRKNYIPIIVRVENNSIKMDIRTIEENEFEIIHEALLNIKGWLLEKYYNRYCRTCGSWKNFFN